MFPFRICLTSQMPRNADDADSLTALKVQECLQYRRAIVVQEEVVPASLHEFGKYDSDMLFGILFLHIQRIFHDWLDNKSER
jgi:hypothetical protein